MIIQTASVSIHFKPITDIKRRYYNCDKVLEGEFQEPTMLPVPDNAYQDYPRIIVMSNNGHSQLTLTMATATLSVNFNAGYEYDWGKCGEYISQKVGVVEQFLHDLGVDGYTYAGLMSTVLFDEIKEGTVEYVKNKLLSPFTNFNEDTLEELVLKYTFVRNHTYYVNLQVQNARIFPADANPMNAGDFSESNLENEFVGVVIDINDRYQFNNNEKYRAGKEMLKKLVDEMGNVLDNDIRGFLGVD